METVAIALISSIKAAVKLWAGEFNVPLLAQLPLDISIREHADGGSPLLVSQPDSEIAAVYQSAARQLGLQMAVSGQISADNRIPVVQAP